MNNVALELKNISKSFEDKKVVDLQYFALRKNEKIVINGENGCGKSTLMKIIKGIIKADDGTINTYNSEIGMIFSGAKGFYGYLSAYENIKYYLGLNKIKIKEVNEKFNYLVKVLNFGEHINKTFDSLSLGNKQKCAIIAGFLLNSNVLLMDEPTLGLDIESTKTITDLIQKYEGSIIVITHDIELIKQLKFDVFFMENGNIKTIQSYKKFLENVEIKVKYLFKTQEDLSDICNVIEGEYYVVTDKNFCKDIFDRYTVIEFKVVI